MANAKVIAGSSRMERALRLLRDQWLITEATWSDSVRRRFQERHFTPLEPAVEAARVGMQKLAEVLDQVRRDCSDRGEMP